MIGSEEAVELVTELVDARRDGDVDAMLRLTTRIIRGRRKQDVFRVVALMANAASEGMTLLPGETFHRLRVTYTCTEGHLHEGDADDLPPPLRVFSQISVAAANGDGDLMRDLFIGYAGRSAMTAQRLLLAGAAVLAHGGHP